MFDSKLQFFLWWISTKAYYKKRSSMTFFGYTKLRKRQDKHDDYIGSIMLNDDGDVTVLVDDQGTWEPIPKEIFDRDDKKLTAWYRSDEWIELKPGDLPNVKAKVKTTYGEAFMNAVILIAPFGDRVGYVSREDYWLTPKDFLKAVESVPRAPNKTEPKPGEITPRDFWNFVWALAWVQWTNPMFTPAATPETLSVDPEVEKLAKELLQDAFDRGLNTDPVHMAWVEGQITKLDREKLKGTPGAMFMQDSGKAYDVARKRMFLTYGVEGSIESPDKVETIAQPLSHGLDLTRLPEQANTMRGGIAGRGLGTALGGADAKKDSRMLQNTSFNSDDCKVTWGRKLLVQPSMVGYLEGRYLVGKDKPITKDEAEKYLWKVVEIRDPSACRHTSPNYCKRCAGDKASRMENSAALQAMQKDNAIMYQTAMSRMHGNALSITKYDMKSRLH